MTAFARKHQREALDRIRFLMVVISCWEITKHSMDSRYWQNTFVEKDAIVAEVAVRYWPLNKIGTVD